MENVLLYSSQLLFRQIISAWILLLLFDRVTFLLHWHSQPDEFCHVIFLQEFLIRPNTRSHLSLLSYFISYERTVLLSRKQTSIRTVELICYFFLNFDSSRFFFFWLICRFWILTECQITQNSLKILMLFFKIRSINWDKIKFLMIYFSLLVTSIKFFLSLSYLTYFISFFA